MSWRAFLLDIRSGRVGVELPLAADAGSWRETLNGIPEWSLKLGKADMGSIPDSALLPWAQGTLVTFDGHPILAGPIVKPYAETTTTITVECRGIEQTISGWRVLAREHTLGGELRDDAPLRLEGLSLGEIQWRLVQTQMQRLGVLPIVHGVPASTGIHERTYDAWNLSNNECFQRIQEVSEVIGGPDFAFWPEWVARDVDVRWSMVHGIVEEALPQVHEPVIDLTATHGPVATFTPIRHWDPATCVYGIGAGQGAGTLISIQRPAIPEGLRIPAREDVLPDTGTDVWDLVQAHARAEGDSRVWPTIQLSVDLSVDHQSAGLVQWRNGHAAQVTVGSDWRSVPAGTSLWRSIARHGQIGATTYSVELQEA